MQAFLHPVIHRWFHFWIAAFVTGVLLWSGITLISLTEIPQLNFFLAIIPGIAFAIALVMIRERPSQSRIIVFLILLSLMFLILGGLGLVLTKSMSDGDIGSGTRFKWDITGLMITGSLLAVISAKSYRNFLIPFHPPVVELILLGMASIVIPHVLIEITKDSKSIYNGWLEVIPMVMSWHIVVGYSFSKNSPLDDTDEDHWTKLIRKIGK